ncbi:MAG: hypothetical protein WC549_01975 [Actinomycetota bacterium]
MKRTIYLKKSDEKSLDVLKKLMKNYHNLTKEEVNNSFTVRTAISIAIKEYSEKAKEASNAG